MTNTWFKIQSQTIFWTTKSFLIILTLWNPAKSAPLQPQKIFFQPSKKSLKKAFPVSLHVKGETSLQDGGVCWVFFQTPWKLTAMALWLVDELPKIPEIKWSLSGDICWFFVCGDCTSQKSTCFFHAHLETGPCHGFLWHGGPSPGITKFEGWSGLDSCSTWVGWVRGDCIEVCNCRKEQGWASCTYAYIFVESLRMPKREERRLQLWHVKLQLLGYENIWRQGSWLNPKKWIYITNAHIQTWYNTQWPSCLQHVLLNSGLGWVHQPGNLRFSGFSMLWRSFLSSCINTVTPSCKHESSHMENQVTKKMINVHLDVVTYLDMVKKNPAIYVKKTENTWKYWMFHFVHSTVIGISVPHYF